MYFVFKEIDTIVLIWTTFFSKGVSFYPIESYTNVYVTPLRMSSVWRYLSRFGISSSALTFRYSLGSFADSVLLFLTRSSIVTNKTTKTFRSTTFICIWQNRSLHKILWRFEWLLMLDSGTSEKYKSLHQTDKNI